MDFPMIPVPMIQGHYFSFASIEASILGQKVTGFTAINYSTSLEPSDVYGTKPQKLGTTRGKQNAEGSCEMYLQDWEYVRSLLGAAGIGYGEMRFPIVVQYGEIGVPVKTDVLVDVRVTRVEYSNSDGTDAAKVSLTLNIMRVQEGLKGSIAAPLGIV